MRGALSNDVTSLIGQVQERLPLLVDQGTEDQFLHEQLKPEVLARAFHMYNQ